jgi:hypothetical protein
MKKLKLTIALILIWFASFSQDFNKVYSSVYSTYEYGSWVTKETYYPKDMYLTINKYDIRINNNEESHFKTYGDPQKNYYSTHECFTWNCIDKKGLDCKFMIKRFYENNTFIMSFLYLKENAMFEYVIEQD